MKKLLILFIVFIMACGSSKTLYNGNSSYQELDSILKAERVLTYDSLPLQDYETKENFWVYYFIRDSLTLRWIKRGDSVHITKRINK
jgi:hypothetical protein